MILPNEIPVAQEILASIHFPYPDFSSYKTAAKPPKKTQRLAFAWKASRIVLLSR